VRSKALNRAFNRALVDLEYRQSLLQNVRGTLGLEGVPEVEIRLLESSAPHDIRELAQALEQMHIASFH
jgi:UDP-N-acetylenolpyruvoylglucosamine reductase